MILKRNILSKGQCDNYDYLIKPIEDELSYKDMALLEFICNDGETISLKCINGLRYLSINVFMEHHHFSKKENIKRISNYVRSIQLENHI